MIYNQTVNVKKSFRSRAVKIFKKKKDNYRSVC